MIAEHRVFKPRKKLEWETNTMCTNLFYIFSDRKRRK